MGITVKREIVWKFAIAFTELNSLRINRRLFQKICLVADFVGSYLIFHKSGNKNDIILRDKINIRRI